MTSEHPMLKLQRLGQEYDAAPEDDPCDDWQVNVTKLPPLAKEEDNEDQPQPST
jgi:hypothetical protein